VTEILREDMIPEEIVGENGKRHLDLETVQQHQIFMSKVKKIVCYVAF
jgi:hypothetical protein